MVGEIRDNETAELAVHAALTGHIVLSTLHTNNAFQAPQRLVEMGVQPFLAASVINVVIGQRLVRKICRHCLTRSTSRVKVLERFAAYVNLPGSFAKLQRLGLLPTDKTLADVPFAHGRGCERCNHTGYQGRVGIYEVMPIDDELHSTILRDYTAQAVRATAIKQGTLAMVEDGLLKVFTGQTTLDEVVRVTKE
jgi:type II secretory ATPase GspE/PulE/Tfp pilus assembly ATPase PilB-like protein